MVKKAAVKPAEKKTAAKRKPAKKKPVAPKPVAETTTEFPWRLVVRYAAFGGAMLLFGAMGGVWSAGGIEIGPSPAPADAVSKSFDEYETLWRAVQVAAADKLDSGEFTKSQQVTEYRSRADGAAIKKTRQPLLDAEFAEFGGDKWTTEKASKLLRSYGQ